MTIPPCPECGNKEGQLGTISHCSHAECRWIFCMNCKRTFDTKKTV